MYISIMIQQQIATQNQIEYERKNLIGDIVELSIRKQLDLYRTYRFRT